MADKRILELISTTDDDIWIPGAIPGNNRRINLSSAIVTFVNTFVIPIFNDYVPLVGNSNITGSLTLSSSITAQSIVKVGGLSTQFLKADGSVDTNTYVTNSLLSANILVGNASNIATVVSMSGDATLSNTGVLTIGDDKVTDAKIRNSAGFSVIGRSASSSGDPADISASTDGHVLRRRGATLDFGRIDNSSIDNLDWGKLLNNLSRSEMSTVILEGCELTPSATPGAFDMAAGIGVFVDTTDPENVIVTKIVIGQQLAIPVTNIATQPATYIGISASQVVSQYSTMLTPSQRRDQIFLGVVVHSDRATVNVCNSEPAVGLSVISQLHDLMHSIGFFNINGNTISANGANLSINKDEGTAFKAGANFINDPKNPNELTLGSLSAPESMRYRLSDSTEYTDTQFIDPNFYENAGVKTAVPSNQWTIQRIYVFPSNIIRIQYGQHIYVNKSTALEALDKETFNVESNLAANGLFLCSLVVKQGATNLSSSAEAEFFKANRFGESSFGGSSAVGTLQDSYNNSLQPEITTNATLGAVSFKEGTGAGTLAVVEVLNAAGTQTAYISGAGLGRFVTLNVSGLASVDSLVVDVGGATIAQDVRARGARFTGEFDGTGLTGGGVEVQSLSGTARILSYNRTSGLREVLEFDALSYIMRAGTGTQIVTIDSSLATLDIPLNVQASLTADSLAVDNGDVRIFNSYVSGHNFEVEFAATPTYRLIKMFPTANSSGADGASMEIELSGGAWEGNTKFKAVIICGNKGGFYATATYTGSPNNRVEIVAYTLSDYTYVYLKYDNYYNYNIRWSLGGKFGLGQQDLGAPTTATPSGTKVFSSFSDYAIAMYNNGIELKPLSGNATISAYNRTSGLREVIEIDALSYLIRAGAGSQVATIDSSLATLDIPLNVQAPVTADSLTVDNGNVVCLNTGGGVDKGVGLYTQGLFGSEGGLSTASIPNYTTNADVVRLYSTNNLAPTLEAVNMGASLGSLRSMYYSALTHKFNVGSNRTSVTTVLEVKSDGIELKGGLEFTQSISSASVANNTLFLDSADNIIKIKDNAGVIQTLY